MAKKLLLLILLINFCTPSGFCNEKTDSLFMALEQVKNEKEEAQTLRRLASVFLNTDPVEAQKHVDRAYSLAHEINFDEEIFQTTVLIAEISSKQSNYEKAIEYALISENLAEKSKDKQKIAQVKVMMANVYLVLSDLDKALELFFESLKIFESIESKKGVMVAMNGIGIVYHEQQNAEKANEYFTKCYEMSKEMGDYVTLEASISNLASTYSMSELYQKSIRYYLEALELNREHSGSKFWECTTLNNLGASYQNSGAYDISFEYFVKAIKLAERLEDIELITACKVNLARHYFKVKAYDSCILYAQKTFDISEKYKFPLHQIESADLLHESFNELKNKDKAYHYSVVYSQLKDSFNIEETIRKTTQIELQYKIEKDLQVQELANQKKKSFQIIIGVIFIALFFIVIVVLIARHRMAIKNINLEKEKTENQLELRNKELALNVMTLLKKNDMLTTISKELYDVKNNALKSETKDAINKIAKKIKKSSEGELWKEFELRFKEVHSDFYDNLLEKHPAISPGELRLCALLRLNMSTKEIAELTGQSTQTLEKARYRIRKKLELSNSSVNLVTYLSGL